MTIIHHELTVPYTAAQMFALVKNVNNYAQFLPHCETSQILGQSKDAFRARLILVKGLMKKTFIIDYYLQGDQSIELRLRDKAFKYVKGHWHFEPLSQGSKLTWHLEYEFANPITAMAYNTLFEQVTNTLVQTFYKQAAVIYGQSAPS